MITEVGIQNYKSISDLKLELGRVTVLIGENGSGKSNILEAIALGSAAAGNKLDNEFLYARGIRVTPDPRFMRAAFDKANVSKDILITCLDVDRDLLKFSLSNDNKLYSSWLKSVSLGRYKLPQTSEYLKLAGLMPLVAHSDISQELIANTIKGLEETGVMVFSPIRGFLIYAPENTCLRDTKEGQIQPLGARGEGLFRFVKYLATFEGGERLKDVKERMQFLGWFKDFKSPSESTNEVNLEIRDNFISEEVGGFNELSANEGFLFLLFYFCLLVGKETPNFFAIDNVDTSLNPKLCTRLVKEMAILAKKYDKQLILTTHNPAILDGLNLDDDEQRLFVVGRDIDGHTTVRRVMKPRVEEGKTPVRLSEAFLRGYLGGLPGNF
ncbi:MAG: AAA family ATPase [Armatimonadetes bacterium]|nr:AAA family ATPase [Armatimonadota bacterium]